MTSKSRAMPPMTKGTQHLWISVVEWRRGRLGIFRPCTNGCCLLRDMNHVFSIFPSRTSRLAWWQHYWGCTWLFSLASLMRQSSLHCLLAAKCPGSSGTFLHIAWRRTGRETLAEITAQEHPYGSYIAFEGPRNRKPSIIYTFKILRD